MQRFRNLRANKRIRNKNAEVFISQKDLILPYFVVDGKNIKKEIPGFTEVYHYSIDALLKDISNILEKGIDKILLFGVIASSFKDKKGSYAFLENNLVYKAIASIKEKFPRLCVISDVCLCGYTTHGHCGLIKNKKILNDETLSILSKIALNYARAGADYVAPSAMMDGQVEAIRAVLEKNGFAKTRIMSYSAKFASNFYGPFRSALSSSPSFLDRKTYQIDFRTINQAVEETGADISEGADIVIIKPAHTYLDVIVKIKQKYPKMKIAGYHVSGEYMMLKAAAETGIIDEKEAVLEVLTSIKRAGADYIITYYAKKAAGFLNEKK